jgi:hypothetical protein
MLDSPDGVCAGQAGFEYPATSAPFSSSSPPCWSRPQVSGAGYTGGRETPMTRVDLCRQQFMGVWRSGSACRLQRQTRAISLSCGYQQEQPFVQVSPEYSLSSK